MRDLLHIVLSVVAGQSDVATVSAGLTIIFILYLPLLDWQLGQSETLLKKVDQRLAEVLLRPVAVQEVSLIWVDLWGSPEKH